MKISHFFIMLLGSGILTAVFVSNFSKLISVTTDFSNIQDSSTIYKTNPFDKLKISNDANNLFWFLQISDLHISNFHDEERITNLKQFCDVTVSIIEPSIVLASGDLTDAKEADNVGSRQIVEEWIHYKNILSKCKALERVKWLDIRGNHDNFDVPGRNSDKNLYKNYSYVGGLGHSFSHSFTTSDGRVYTFIGIDACPEQGLRRPFNFVGLLRENEIKMLRNIVASHPLTDYFIWFGHYPTSCILSHHNQVRKVIGEDKRSLVYLCGHLHTLGGLVPRMYTLQQQGFLELELADWKDNRMYRLLAIDHGLLSFIDVKFDEWPVILVTNPKRPIYASNREPVQNIATSDHIRVLIFSPGKIRHVGVNILKSWKACTHVKGPLYTLEWDPSVYPPGLNTIQVSAVDDLGNEKTIIHEFSIDGTQYHYNLLARICLMTNISSSSQLLFGLIIVSCTLPLCIFKYLRRCTFIESNEPKAVLPQIESRFIRTWLRRLWMLSNIDRFFYPTIAYPLYITVGPWFIGELMRGHTGIIFVWGTFINNSYIPGAFTYTFGFKQLLLFQWPFIIVLSCLLDYRLLGQRCMRRLVLANACMLFLVLSQIYLLYYFWLAYGTMAVILGPFRTYPAILYIYAWRQSHNIHLSIIRTAVHPWIKES